MKEVSSLQTIMISQSMPSASTVPAGETIVKDNRYAHNVNSGDRC